MIQLLLIPDWSYGTVSDIEGNVYKTIQIGSQVMDGGEPQDHNITAIILAIPLVTDSSIWGTLTTPACCWYDNDLYFKDLTIGALYNWFAVSTGKLCPAGWHVPSVDEWHEMIRSMGTTISGWK